MKRNPRIQFVERADRGTRFRICKRGGLCLLIACLYLPFTSDASADVSYSSRGSQLTLTSANMGGLEILTSTSDPNLIFSESFFGTHVQNVVGGGINTGSWRIEQFSQLESDMITVFGQSDTTMAGTGLGILNATNVFDAEFVSVGDTLFELSGTHFGTTSAVGAKDFIEIQLQQFDGVTFQNLFTTGVDDLNSGPFSGTLEDGELYRLSVLSRANVFGNESNASGYDVQLSFTSVPEPASGTVLGLLGLSGWLCRRRR